MIIDVSGDESRVIQEMLGRPINEPARLNREFHCEISLNSARPRESKEASRPNKQDTHSPDEIRRKEIDGAGESVYVFW